MRPQLQAKQACFWCPLSTVVVVPQAGLKSTMLLSHCPQACLLSRSPAPCPLHMVAALSVAAVASQMSVLLGAPRPLVVVPQAPPSATIPTILLNHCPQARLSSRAVAPCLLPASQQLLAVQPAHCMHFCTCPCSHPAPNVHAMLFIVHSNPYGCSQSRCTRCQFCICAPPLASSLCEY